MSYRPHPANDPNEAYAVIPMPAKRHCPPTGWWTVTHSGVPVRHFPPDKRDLAERFATDPAFRFEFVSKNRPSARARTIGLSARARRSRMSSP
jgi:hypothetical protein